MFKHLLCLLIATLGCFQLSFAQYNLKENNVWVFPQSLGLDFNPTTATTTMTAMSGDEAAASVCDAAGQLLFYTNGTTIWDRNHNMMTPYSLPGVQWITTMSTTQGAQIVEMIDSPGKYYVFSLTDIDGGFNGGPYYQGHLFYTVVDMSLNGGVGGIDPLRKWIEIDTGLSEKMVAVPGDNCDIWLVVHHNERNQFRTYRITGNGIDPNPILSNVGVSGTAYLPGAPMNLFWTQGQMCISPDRKKLAQTNYTGEYTELFDFDAITGTVSNSIVVDSSTAIYNWYAYGVAFSPDSKKLYVNNTLRAGGYLDLYQFDLTNPTKAAIKASKTLITPPATPGLNYLTISQLRLGPDGKLYYFADTYHPTTSYQARLSVVQPRQEPKPAGNNTNTLLPRKETGYWDTGTVRK